MTADVNTVLEPSASTPVVETPKLPADPYKWTPEQREHWNRTGEIPETPKKQDSAPASTPEKKAEPEPKGKSAAESGTAPEKQEKRGGKKSAEDRISELIAENKILKERERSRDAAPKPTTVDAKPEPKTETKKPTRPNPYTFKGTPEEYEKAMDEWDEYRGQQAKAEAREENQRAARLEQFNARVAAARQHYGEEFGAVADAAAEQVMQANLHPIMRDYVLGSEYLPHLLFALQGESTLARFLEKANKDPYAAIRDWRDLENDVEDELERSEARANRLKEYRPTRKSQTKPKSESKAETKPESPEPKPRAPKPPIEVGGRGAPAERADFAAARAGNFRDFDAEMKRRYGANK